MSGWQSDNAGLFRYINQTCITCAIARRSCERLAAPRLRRAKPALHAAKNPRAHMDAMRNVASMAKSSDFKRTVRGKPRNSPATSCEPASECM